MAPRFIFRFSAASCLLFAATPSTGADIHCPASLTETPSVSQSDPAWVIAVSPGVRPLEHVGVYLGSAPDYGAQAPDSTHKARLRETVTWSLVRAPNDSFWVGCSYTGTTAMALKQIDPQAKQCIAIYELLPSGRRQRLSAFRCQ